MDTWALITFGVAVHLVFFYSIFDIYFTSPVVHGMTPFQSNMHPPAKRLVLFVTDGLRADKFFELDENKLPRAPYLRHIIEEKGCWGVSHTRVPTESRPGHVALIAGFYEDVSAVAKGWKENPVEFDSVFNESHFTWSWGSPDILPMFAKGASGDHVFMDYYPSEKEDFAASDSSKLDTWVFEKVKKFLAEASEDETINKKLHQDKIVFFLHLLGLDTNGHSHKPYSSEYLKNIGTVDSGVQEIEQLFEEFYNHDNGTAYVLSADHGMTDWGSHGAGHPSETLTPLVAWGAGVRGPRHEDIKMYTDGFSEKWDLQHLQRTDVMQADVAPLMAALIGIPYPVNSVGLLPVDVLDIPDSKKAECMFANAQQILAQFKVKMKQKQATTLSLTFKPFKELMDDKQLLIKKEIKQLIKTGQFSKAIEESKMLIELALQGLGYYQNYDRFFLGLSISSGFVGWTLYVMTLILQEHSGISSDRRFFDVMNTPFLLSDRFIEIIAAFTAIIIVWLIAIQSLPWTYYIYCLIPILLWMFVLKRWYIFTATWGYLRKFDASGVIVTCVLCTLELELLVAGFFYRQLLLVGLISIGIWPLFSEAKKENKYKWLASCLVLAVFPLLPVVGREINHNWVLFAGVIALVLGLFSVRYNTEFQKGKKYYLNYVQLVILALSLYLLWSTSSSIKRREGLQKLNQMFSWIILLTSFVIPLFSSTQILQRLFSIVFAFLPVYLLLSILQEGMFIVCFSIVMFLWLRLEQDLHFSKTKDLRLVDFTSSLAKDLEPPRHLVAEDVRRSLFYMFFILTAFFGTGNIASINSFEPASVYCFLTIFNPFVMGALMMLKNLLPLVLVSCMFRAIHILTNIPTRALFLIVMIMSDLMALNFFFLVQDHGSWLEIGTSISHYVIVMCMNIFLMILFGVSHSLTTISISNLIKQNQ